MANNPNTTAAMQASPSTADATPPLTVTVPSGPDTPASTPAAQIPKVRQAAAAKARLIAKPPAPAAKKAISPTNKKHAPLPTKPAVTVAKRPYKPVPLHTPTALLPPATPKPAKGKPVLVRDSFTMPQADFALVALLKERALGFRRPTKKSELLRAGLHALVRLSDAQLRLALDALVPLKPGRPKKNS